METLNKALAEAEQRAAQEQDTRQKHEARVGEVQQELQDAMKKCESLERQNVNQESKLTKARQSAQVTWAEAQGTLREIQEAKRSWRVRLLLCKASMGARGISY